MISLAGIEKFITGVQFNTNKTVTVTDNVSCKSHSILQTAYVTTDIMTIKSATFASETNVKIPNATIIQPNGCTPPNAKQLWQRKPNINKYQLGLPFFPSCYFRVDFWFLFLVFIWLLIVWVFLWPFQGNLKKLICQYELLCPFTIDVSNRNDHIHQQNVELVTGKSWQQRIRIFHGTFDRIWRRFNNPVFRKSAVKKRSAENHFKIPTRHLALLHRSWGNCAIGEHQSRVYR